MISVYYFWDLTFLLRLDQLSSIEINGNFFIGITSELLVNEGFLAQYSNRSRAANTASVNVPKTKSACCLMSVLKSVTHILFV